jgi:hypothetical protein
MEQVQPATTANALAACRDALVGEGAFQAKVLFTQQAPFLSSGKLVAFNGRWQGRPAILAHVYGPKPVPTSYTLPFVIGAVGHGTYGTTLSASLPRFTSKWGYVTGISLSLGRGFLLPRPPPQLPDGGLPGAEGLPRRHLPLARQASPSAGTGLSTRR